jgi:hypothetical protein
VNKSYFYEYVSANQNKLIQNIDIDFKKIECQFSVKTGIYKGAFDKRYSNPYPYTVNHLVEV